MTPAAAGSAGALSADREARRPGQEQRDFWERSRTGWHVAFGAMAAVTAVPLAAAALDGSGRALAAVVALAAAGAVYPVLAAPMLRAPDVRGWRIGAWAAVLLVAVLLVQEAAGGGLALPLLFVLFPQAWAMTTRRLAVVVVAAVPLVLAGAEAAGRGWSSAGLRDAAFTGLLQVGPAVVLGLWITGLVRESETRAELVAQLTQARAELAAADHARGVLAERSRMAGEIHDTLAQGFTSIVALAQAADDAVATLSGPQVGVARERLALVESTARVNLAEARAIVAATAPPDLHGAAGGDRLSGALARLVARVDAEGALRVRLEDGGPVPPISAEAEVVLLRAAQEGLTNAGRHAGASTAVVALAVDVEGVELTVSDDGSGLGPAGTGGPGAGYGLAAMAARAAQVGGSAALEASPAGGCVLRVRVPLGGVAPPTGPEPRAAGALA